MPTHSYLGHLALFCCIVDSGSLRGASRELDVPLATLKRRLDEFERLVGHRLVVRDRRAPRPTAEGALLHEYANPLVRALVDAVDETRGTDRRRRTLRIGAPLGVACALLLPFLSQYLGRHRRLCIDLCLTDGAVDLETDGFDLALVEGATSACDLISRPLVQLPRRLVVAPGYVERRGMPASVAALREHDCVVQRDRPRVWWFRQARGEFMLRVDSRLAVASALGVAEAVRAGAGIALLPAYIADPAMAAGTLREVPLAVVPRPEPLVAFYPTRLRHDATLQRLLTELAADLAGRLTP